MVAPQDTTAQRHYDPKNLGAWDGQTAFPGYASGLPAARAG